MLGTCCAFTGHRPSKLPWKYDETDSRCVALNMLDRNRFMVDHASTLLAVYKGARRSGTGAMVNYARKMGREIIVIDPITRQISHGEFAPSPAHP